MVDRPTYPTPTRVLWRTPATRAVAPGVPEAHPVPRSPKPLGSKQSKKSFPDSLLGSGSKPDDPPTASASAPGAGRVMVVASTTPGPADPGPQVPRSESSDYDAQTLSKGESAPTITPLGNPFRGPVSPRPWMPKSHWPGRSYWSRWLGKLSTRSLQFIITKVLLLDMLKNQLAYLPDLSDLRPESNIDDAVVGEPGESDPEEEERLRAVLRKHRMIFLGEGNALSPPARGVVCDLDVGDEKPISMRSRRIPADLLSKVETGLIEYSNSEWASAIVLVMKKNGTDVRLCIDYRLVNQLIKLMNYPLPLIDELMSNFAATMWFMTLDMASGFWAVPMTARPPADLGLHLPARTLP
ncbi:reverse transcriptase, partial [Phytophthora megakarya]